ncbi:hypothetical protein [Treponema parvum]|uniref:hypothetical protein n=1 Tax=Treponema parvum TaxID=138851 RepID=UPI001AEC1CDB|nr:hypothetical protein [Treponema parvum]QTQ15524.1 hypothetical protein HXT04_01710 [Treponema parvum]
MKLKKPFIVSFFILFGAGCFIWSFLYGNLPAIFPHSIVRFRILRALAVFFKGLPAVMCTAFLFEFSLEFGRDPSGSTKRFSSGMLERYRLVIIVSLILSLVLTLCVQVFLPAVNKNLSYIERQPELRRLYVEMSEQSKEQGNNEAAYMYMLQASEIDPHNERIEDSLRQLKIASEYKKEDPKIEAPLPEPEKDEAPAGFDEMLDKAKKAFKNEDWLYAHYCARTAVNLAAPGELNLDEAERLSVAAWKKLSEVSASGDTDTQKLFERKMEGYNAFIRGDYLDSYYIFNELNLQNRKADPDVKRYFALSERNLKDRYFFNDEYKDLQKYETVSDLYFTIKKSDGSSEVYFIRGITNIGRQGNLVRFLRDFTVTYFDKDGFFTKSLSVPYAKMFSVSSSLFPELGGDEKFVPYILLDSINRLYYAGIERPEYRYAKANAVQKENNYLILDMPYEDFEILSYAPGGAENMDLFSLFEFVFVASKYGYPSEAYAAVLQERLLYPFSLLLFFLFFALMSWNYRIEEDVLFKFRWIFTIPFFILFVHVFLRAAFYIVRLINFTAAYAVELKWTLAFSSVVDLIAFIFLSVLFLARKK